MTERTPPLPTSGACAWLALGGNLGSAQDTLQNAIQAIAQIPHTQLLAASSLYRSKPVDASGPDFINAVVQVQTTLSPHALLAACHAIENAAGRQRVYRNAPRTLDIDILLYDNVHIESDTLNIPHPRMYQRAFVLLPLAEIAPQWVTEQQLHAVADQDICKLPARIG